MLVGGVLFLYFPGEIAGWMFIYARVCVVCVCVLTSRSRTEAGLTLFVDDIVSLTALGLAVSETVLGGEACCFGKFMT